MLYLETILNTAKLIKKYEMGKKRYSQRNQLTIPVPLLLCLKIIKIKNGLKITQNRSFSLMLIEKKCNFTKLCLI